MKPRLAITLWFLLIAAISFGDDSRPAITIAVQFDNSVKVSGTNGLILELSDSEALSSLQALPAVTNSAIKIRFTKGYRLLSAAEQGAVLRPITNFCSRMNARIASVRIDSAGFSGIEPEYDLSWRYSLTNLLPWLPPGQNP